MKNGIIRDNEGFEILVNGTSRTFRDEREAVLDAARVLKARNKGHDKVEIVDRAAARTFEMMADGQIR